MKTSVKLGAFIALMSMVTLPGVAHASLESTTMMSTIEPDAPDANLVLTFPTGLNLSETRIEVFDERSNRVATEAPEPGRSETELNVPLARPLRPGVYTVKWHAVSVGGRHVQGAYNFNVDP